MTAARPVPRFVMGVMRLVAALVVISALAAHYLKQEPPLPDYGPMPAFTLVDQTGAPFDGASLRGAVVVVNFIFTACPDVCPALSAALSSVGARTANTKVPVRLLSVSVDPERDTPDVLAAYGRRFDADAARWTFLTGAPETVRATLKGFAQIAEKVPVSAGKPEDYNVAHSESLLLYDKDGVLRGIYGSTGEELTRLVTDTRRLAGD